MGQKAHQRPQQIVKSHCMVQKTTMENIIFTHSFINLCRTNVFHTLVFCRLSWTSLWDLPPPTHSLRFLSNSSPYLLLLAVKRGLPGWLSGTEPTCQCRGQRRRGFVSWVGKIPWRRAWHPSPVFSPGKSHDRGAWWATVHRVAKSQTRLIDQTHTHQRTFRVFPFLLWITLQWTWGIDGPPHNPDSDSFAAAPRSGLAGS